MPKIIALIVSVFLVFSPTSGFGADASWHDEQRLGQLLVLVVAVLSLLYRPQARSCGSVWLKLPLLSCWGLLALFAVGLLSASFAAHPHWAYLEASLFALLVLLAISIASLPQWRNDWLLATVLAVTSVYFVGICVAYSAAVVGEVPLRVWELFYGFSNIRFFGQFQSLTLPLLVLPALLWTLPTRYRLLLSVLNASWWMLAIASGTRGTWLAMGGAACVAAFCGTAGRIWLRAQLKYFLAGSISYLIFFHLLPLALGMKLETLLAARIMGLTSLSSREVIWNLAWELIRSHPWLGVGPMHFADYPNRVAAHPHNVVLQWAAEWGVPSALLVVIGIYHGLRGMMERVRSEVQGLKPNLLRLGLLASIVAGLTQALVDGVIVMPYSQTLLAVIIGCALGQHLELAPTQKRRVRVGLVWLGVVLAAALVSVVSHIPRDTQYFYERHVAFAKKYGGLPQPRFWMQGTIYE